MTDVLILGGTGWLSARIAERWAARGARVTCLARGARPAPEGAVLVVGDRDDPASYEALRHDWDEIVDISSRADHVEQAVTALGDHAARWTFVSSMSVYDDETTGEGDETMALLAPAEPGDEYDYGRQKVAAEQAVLRLGDRARIIRPGLITGTGDPSDRFGYWAAAFARARSAPVLTPSTAGRWAQVIDVDDLATFVVDAGGGGVVNAVGDPHPLRVLLEEVRAAAAHTGAVVEAPDAWLEARGVQYWMGERSLPLWLPADMPGFARRRNDAYRAAGGTVRPVQATIAAVLDDERRRGLDRPRRAGLIREDEAALLAELGE